MIRKILFLLAIVCFGANTSAQVERNNGASVQNQQRNIVPVEQFLTSARSNNDTRAISLVKDAHPSSYVQNGNVKTYGDNPVCLFTDVRSFATLNRLDFPKNDIEIVTIRIKSASELSTVLDFSQLSSFPKLQYVYLLSETQANTADFVHMIQNNDPRTNVFYNFALTK